MKTYRYATLGFAVIVAACGKPDASGIYLVQTDHEVSMVQLVQSDNGKVTGRLQSNVLESDGTIDQKSAPADGAVSGHNLLLQPSSAWFGGVQASGEFDGGKLTLTGQGFTLEAAKSTLEKYQQALDHLEAVAADNRHRIATQNAVAAGKRAEENAAQQIRSQAQNISAVVARIRADTGRLSDALDLSPDFGRAASANTAKVAQMRQAAPRLPETTRAQLGVAANQIMVATNQIEVQRNQYAIGLNQIVEDVKENAGQLGKLCGKVPPAQLTEACNSARPAAAEFKAAFDRGRSAFTPYKAQVQAEIGKQNMMIQQIEAR